MKSNSMRLVLVVLAVVMIAGCTDISDSFKPGSFGTTAEETEVVDAITDKYGDITAKGQPRFLEVLMTSEVNNFIPVDQVSKYSLDSSKLYAWFVYDNFDNDELSIEWTYLDEEFTIHTFRSRTGEDFGRGTFILEQPDDGWPLGDYEVTISGAGVSESVRFEIIDGATVSSPLELLGTTIGTGSEGSAGTEPAESKPGWYLVETNDFDPVEKNNDYYSYGLDFERGDVTTTTMGKKGEILKVRTTWTQPPTYVPSEGEISIRVVKEGLEVNTKELGLKDTTLVSIDEARLGLGSGTAFGYNLEDPDVGDKLDFHGLKDSGTVSATFSGNAPPEGKERFGLRVQIHPGGYKIQGTQYVYEWRD